MPISPARRAAFDILMRVERGGFASDLLAALPPTFDRRDLNLATELVLGSLRRQNQLDHLIRQFSGRSSKFDIEVLIALRLGIYQLRYLDRVPRHAAVDESVSLTRTAGKGSASGLVNAVLRKVDDRPPEYPSPAVIAGLPEWLHAKWNRTYGAAVTAAIATACVTAPDTYLRVPAGREAEAVALGAEPTDLAGCYRLPPGRDPGAAFRLQDYGSQSLVPLLELNASHSFLDLCAAPGNKTAQALESGVRFAVASDHSVKRLHSLAPLGVPLVALDASRPLPFFRPFDRILVDAPCSGTGTLARNPEIRWRLQPQELQRHQARQIAILSSALTALAPGGRLVYSTCSLELDENEAVLDAVLAQSGPEFALETTIRRLPGRDPGDGFFAGVIKSGVPPIV